MKDAPNCLNRRYKVVDELIQEISLRSAGNSGIGSTGDTSQAGIKLMCDFWNILKENPECNLAQAVKEKMGLLKNSSGFHPPRRVTCYMAGTGNDEKHGTTPTESCCHYNPSPPNENESKCCTTSTEPGTLQLTKVLCNLKEAASFDKNCAHKINVLEEQQQTLEEQIKILEAREKEGVVLLKKAECMWTCMEDAYKKKLAESAERQKLLLKQLMEVETSTSKWRKNKKDLEMQIVEVEKCHRDIKEKLSVKKNDLQCLEIESTSLSKRADASKKEAEKAKSAFEQKKQNSESREASTAEKIAKIEKQLKEQRKLKLKKENEGAQYIKEARDELQKLGKALVQKKMENSNLLAQKDEMLSECEILKKNFDECQGKCQNKRQSLKEEIKKIEAEIADMKIKCVKCHECTDTVDLRKLCSDCPRCLQERDCLVHGDYCEADASMECVCMSVKQKFMDNVFENMYTVLERQSSTKAGRAVADAVLNSLNRSINGKLDDDTRKIVRDFILTTVKKNLNITVIGGAVKTRCEMDTDTYNQLMRCLKDVKVTKPVKVDKQTVPRKGPCRRWGGSHDCNCPKGPKSCICSRKSPPPPRDSTPLPPPEKEDEELVADHICPHREDEMPCGPNCAKHNIPGGVGTEVASWRPNPCSISSCTFSKNMRAAQCVIGPEALNTDLKDKSRLKIPKMPQVSQTPSVALMSCSCGTSPMKPCLCPLNASQVKVAQKECNKSTCESKNNLSANSTKQLVDKKLSYDSKKIIPDGAELKTKNSSKVRTPKIEQSNSSTKKSKRDVSFHDIKRKKNESYIIVPDKDDKSIKKIDESVYEEVEITRTSSGALAVVLDEKMITKIENKVKTDPKFFATLNETCSGRFLLSFQPEASDRGRKLTITKTPSGNTILQLDEPGSSVQKQSNNIDIQCCADVDTKSIQKSLSEEHTKQRVVDTEKYFGIKVKGVGNSLTNLPAVLKLEPSGDYMIVLDKEFEKVHKQAIKTHIRDNNQCIIGLSKADSQNYVIDFYADHMEQNALLMKTKSGTIKILVNNNTFDTLKTIPAVNSTQFQTLLEKIGKPCVEKQFAKKEQCKYKAICQKRSASDSNISEKTRVMLSPDQLSLRKTPSGQYSATLDKESKRELIKNLKSFIEKKSVDFIPIKRSKTGNVTIMMDERADSKGNFNALKITNSGNIFMVVDKDVMKGKISTSPIPVDSNNSRKLIRGRERAIATSCRGRPEDGGCDPSKCGCRKKIGHSNSSLSSYPMCESYDPCCSKIQKNNKTCEVSIELSCTCPTQCCSYQEKGKKPNTYLTPQMRCKDNTYDGCDKHCYNVYDSVSRLYENKCDNISNEISELCSEMCQHDMEYSSSGGTSPLPGTVEFQQLIWEHGSDNWDSLSFLPHQLPSFLKHVNYYKDH